MLRFPIFSQEDKRARKEILDAVQTLAFARAWKLFASWLRTEGWRYSPWQLYEKLADRTFDRIHGVDTRMFAELSEMQIGSPNKRFGQRYQASPVFSLRRLLRRLDIDYPDFAFVDFGSGKGRTLLLAGELPFKRVIGVEFSADLNECAVRNISLRRRGQAESVAALHCDATEFELPPENLVLYFFNPFKAEVLDKVLSRLAASLEAMPRKVIIVYLYLEDRQLLDNLQGFQLREAWHRYRIYTFTPATD
ncbi:MAG: class I SAM-dependent methyltransferase [Massilia sp.]